MQGRAASSGDGSSIPAMIRARSCMSTQWHDKGSEDGGGWKVCVVM